MASTFLYQASMQLYKLSDHIIMSSVFHKPFMKLYVKVQVQEHAQWPRARLLQLINNPAGVYNFFHTKTRPTTIPMAKDKCWFMHQPFTQTQPAMIERPRRTSAPEPPITLHHDSDRIRSRQGVAHASWLTFSLLSMWLVRKSAQVSKRLRIGP